LAPGATATAEQASPRDGQSAMSAFEKLKGKLSKRPGVKNPGGLARTIGEEKYGKKGFAKKQQAGVKKARKTK
jgi:hypothetical protein